MTTAGNSATDIKEATVFDMDKDDTPIDDNNAKNEHQITPPIDNHNIDKEEVILLDTSQNSEWISYVSYADAVTAVTLKL